MSPLASPPHLGPGILCLVLTLAFLGCPSLCLKAQKFQYRLDPGRESPVQDMIETQSGDYLFSSFSSSSINITRLDYLNGIEWSRDYSFPHSISETKILEWPGQHAFLISAFALTNAQNRILMKIDSLGNVLWSRRFGGINDVNAANQGLTDAVVLPSGNVFFVGGASAILNSTGANDLFVGKVDPAGNLIWGRSICFSCLGNFEAAVSDLFLLSDGQPVLTGILTPPAAVGAPTEDLLLMKFDTTGNILWNRAYNNLVGFFGGDEVGKEVKELPNGNLVVAGIASSFSPSFQDGIILETLPNGNYSRALRINIATGSHDVEFDHIIPLDNNTVVVPGSSNENVSPSLGREYNFLAQIKLSGSIDWRWSYFSETSVGFLTFSNALVERKQGGYAYMANFARFFDNLYPVLLSTDELGLTGCDSLISLSTQALILNQLNFLPPLSPSSSSSAYSVLASNFNGYDFTLPNLSLGRDTSICATFSMVLDADVGQPATYAWSTGASSSSIVVDSQDTYYVDINLINECVNLRDTFTVICDTVLPVVFSNFEVREEKWAANFGVRLSFVVRDLAAGLPFLIERRGEGGGYEEIAELYGSGFQDYLDEEPLEGRSFYRLKALDGSGSEFYSNEASFYLSSSSSWNLKQGQDFLRIEIAQSSMVGSEAFLMDNRGRILSRYTFHRYPESFSFSTLDMAWGVYRVMVKDSRGEVSMRTILLRK